MTVRLSLTSNAVLIKVYDMQAPAPVDPYAALCVFVPPNSGRGHAWLRMAEGALDDRGWAEVQLVAVQFGARTILMQDPPAVAIHASSLGADGITRFDLSDLIDRLTQPGDLYG